MSLSYPDIQLIRSPAAESLKSKRKRWISKKEKLSKSIVKVSPADIRDLYKSNIINQVQKDHKTSRNISTTFK